MIVEVEVKSGMGGREGSPSILQGTKKARSGQDIRLHHLLHSSRNPRTRLSMPALSLSTNVRRNIKRHKPRDAATTRYFFLYYSTPSYKHLP